MKKRQRALRQTTRREWLFTVRSRLGFVVRTTRGYWLLIATVKHPSLAGHESEVVRTLAEPDQIRISKVDNSVYLFYRKQGKRYLCVVSKRVDARIGFVMTAYVADKIKEGRVVWKR